MAYPGNKRLKIKNFAAITGNKTIFFGVCVYI